MTLHHHPSVSVSRVNISWCVWQVAFHMQPYKGRTDQSMHDNIKYIIDKWVALRTPAFLHSCTTALHLFPLRHHCAKTASLNNQKGGCEAWMRYANTSGVVVKYRCVLLQSHSNGSAGDFCSDFNRVKCFIFVRPNLILYASKVRWSPRALTIAFWWTRELSALFRLLCSSIALSSTQSRRSVKRQETRTLVWLLQAFPLLLRRPWVYLFWNIDAFGAFRQRLQCKLLLSHNRTKQCIELTKTLNDKRANYFAQECKKTKMETLFLVYMLYASYSYALRCKYLFVHLFAHFLAIHCNPAYSRAPFIEK